MDGCRSLTRWSVSGGTLDDTEDWMPPPVHRPTAGSATLRARSPEDTIHPNGPFRRLVVQSSLCRVRPPLPLTARACTNYRWHLEQLSVTVGRCQHRTASQWSVYFYRRIHVRPASFISSMNKSIPSRHPRAELPSPACSLTSAQVASVCFPRTPIDSRWTDPSPYCVSPRNFGVTIRRPTVSEWSTNNMCIGKQ